MEHSAEQRKRLAADPEYGRAFEEITSKHGLREAAAAGFGRLVETIVCQGQTREHAYGLMQYYERVAKDGAIPAATAVGTGTIPAHTIRFRGEPHVLSSEAGTPGGRLFALFEGNPDPVPPDVAEYVARVFDEFAASR